MQERNFEIGHSRQHIALFLHTWPKNFSDISQGIQNSFPAQLRSIFSNSIPVALQQQIYGFIIGDDDLDAPYKKFLESGKIEEFITELISGFDLIINRELGN